MIRAIIFDCFGVLTTDGWLPFKRKHFGHDQALDAEITDLHKWVNAGQGDYNEFIHVVAGHAKVSSTDVRRSFEDSVPNDELFMYISDRLKPQYSIGLLSNAGSDRLGELFSVQQCAVFDSISLSCNSGLVKPDQRAYSDISAKLRVQPEECLFVDDQERYCQAARDVGMQAIVYQDFGQLRYELDAVLAKPV